MDRAWPPQTVSRCLPEHSQHRGRAVDSPAWAISSRISWLHLLLLPAWSGWCLEFTSPDLTASVSSRPHHPILSASHLASGFYILDRFSHNLPCARQAASFVSNSPPLASETQHKPFQEKKYVIAILFHFVGSSDSFPPWTTGTLSAKPISAIYSSPSLLSPNKPQLDPVSQIQHMFYMFASHMYISIPLLQPSLVV